MTLCSKRRQRSAALLLQWVKGRGGRGGAGSREEGRGVSLVFLWAWHAKLFGMPLVCWFLVHCLALPALLLCLDWVRLLGLLVG